MEGIALVAIFIWDRLDARADHRQMIDQLNITRDQAKASEEAAHAAKRSVEMMINKERARIRIEPGKLDIEQLWDRVRIQAIEQNSSAEAIVIKSLSDYLKKGAS